jgi:hypothetical protein
MESASVTHALRLADPNPQSRIPNPDYVVFVTFFSPLG